MASAKRTSDRLSAYNIERARSAWEHATRIGRPFTHHLTISWDKIDGSGSVQERQGRLLICARHWLQRQNKTPLVAIWAVEPNKPGSGCHTHTVIHLPRARGREFGALLARWTFTEPLEPTTARWKNRKPPQGTVACGGHPDDGNTPIWHLQRRYDDSPKLLDYVLKHSEGQRHRGRVVGKRLGFSNILGPAAIARATTKNTDRSMIETIKYQRLST